MSTIEVINPATGKQVRTYEAHSEQQIEDALNAAVRTFENWKTRSFEERSIAMRQAAVILREKKDVWARLMAEEMGKPLREGRSEAEKCGLVCDFYAENAAHFLADEVIPTGATRSFVTFRPLGVVLAVMPWNFPFWQVFRFLAPALMAGNAAILKHSSNVPGCALAIEQIVLEAGFPKGLFRALLIDSSKVSRVIEDRRIVAATLTGSTPAGRSIARTAGGALKKTVLELGGSDPYVILADADLNTAVPTCVKSRLINNGQSCIAANRFIVVPEVQKSFEEAFVARMRQVRMGDPTDETTDLGPQVREDLRDSLHEQVRRSIEKGARLLLGGEIPNRPGSFYPATVLTDVRPGMPAYEEELFGPVAAIIPAANEQDAIRIANDSALGLGAAVFTTDKARGEAIAAHDLEAGCCFVNDFVRSDPRLPFGGIKTSGYGRELGSYGIKEFVNIKTVYVA